ncbi:hypothetical protein BAR24_09575 [Gluconobacter oxydans]|uniref:hypothetical protein n=1 Tax=Gluconobacter thailandicus TaxID=257438 RepID=UPI0002999B22|nr:hypothetical protein [Gluconobacter thailandicus]AFW02894.1 hypothetical protein B932_3349 [Gluconobacter oxydans H24]ANQ41689.1 hypothetical protein BAR24_09575 [Gluconobacter oxydans]
MISSDDGIASLTIPTLYMLDICVANATKFSKKAMESNVRKAALVESLRELDRDHNSISYFLALLEKTYDPRASLSAEELEAQILHDVATLRQFFVHAKIVESDAVLISTFRAIKRQPCDPEQGNHLNFLRQVNSLGLANPVARTKRLEMANRILEGADLFSIPRNHPTVLITLGSLYGNVHARKVLKFKADINAFSAENAFADISIILRFLSAKFRTEGSSTLYGRSYERMQFLTDDIGLTGLLECFMGYKERIVRQDGINQTIEGSYEIDLANIVTEIDRKADNILPADKDNVPSLSEYDRLYDMIFERTSWIFVDLN